MQIIFTSNGDEILVSDQDFESLNKHKWCLNGKGYACRNGGNKKNVLMHRVLMHPVPQGACVDHINLKILDNRRENLRVVSKAANCRHTNNRMKPSYSLARKKWRTCFRLRGKGRKNYTMSLGDFDSQEKAQAQIDRYHTMCHERQLQGICQEEIFKQLHAIRGEERKYSGERVIERWGHRFL